MSSLMLSSVLTLGFSVVMQSDLLSAWLMVLATYALLPQLMRAQSGLAAQCPPRGVRCGGSAAERECTCCAALQILDEGANLMPVHECKDSTQGIYDLKYSPDGRFLATATYDAWLDVYKWVGLVDLVLQGVMKPSGRVTCRWRAPRSGLSTSHIIKETHTEAHGNGSKST